MALDSRFVIAPDLQMVFRDKDTGLPLRGGVITFYQDQARTVLKPIYKLSGTPPNYTYTELPNPVTLTSAGTFGDELGNDIIPYYFPYDGTPDDTTNTIELYYITVTSASPELVPQFTREGWPNLTATSEIQQDLTNYVPNSQFLIHNDLPAIPGTDIEAGEIRAATTDIAQGGWTFERSASSTARDFVLFERQASPTDNLSADPRYVASIICESPSAGDSRKDLCIKFQNVNKFASDTQQYTFAFWGQSNSGSQLSVDIWVRKFYGSGGSDPFEDNKGTVIFETTYGVIQKSFTFGLNTDKTIGNNNDDYVQVLIRFPVISLFSVEVSDFVLTPGAVTVEMFPQTPDAEFKARGVAGWMSVPDYDGYDLYLTPRLTPQGLMFDRDEIGDIIAESGFNTYTNSISTTTNRLLADGAQYETAAYSPLGIPFARLQEKYFDATLNRPIWGTGRDYLTAHVTDAAGSDQLFISTNKTGAATDASDGTPTTGFTFARVAVGQTTESQGLFVSTDTFWIWANDQGVSTGAIGAGTSGFTVFEILNIAGVRTLISVQTIVAAGLAGDYFQFRTPTPTEYYMWFTVDGAGADPAPGGTGIKVDLKSAMTANDVKNACANAAGGRHIDLITLAAASAITAGSYFNLFTVDDEFYVWYKKDGAGSDPEPVGKIGIQVDILSADTAAQVTTKTQIAINSKYFATPDLRGTFLRGWSDGSTNDPDRATRLSVIPSVYGDLIGTFQLSGTQAHAHTIDGSETGGGDGFTPDVGITGSTGAYGDPESRSFNAYVNYVVKY